MFKQIIWYCTALTWLWVGLDSLGRLEAQEKKAAQSGIELSGRSAKESPYLWHVHDSKTKKEIVRSERGWGFQPLPPGQYAISLTWQVGQGEVFFTNIEVEKDKTAKVQIQSGIELSGRSAKESPYRWHVHDSKTKKEIVRSERGWGFQPLPPGQYAISLTWQVGQGEVFFTNIEVEKDKTAKVQIQSGIELSGRSAKESPYLWHVHDSKTKKEIVRSADAWGFQPLPPGQYTVSLTWQVGLAKVVFTDVEVEKDKVAKIRVASGLELAAGSAKDGQAETWNVYDMKNNGNDQTPIVKLSLDSGFMPLPPGTYTVSARPQSFLRAEVKVLEGQVATVRFPDLKERLARVTGTGLKTERMRDPVGYKKLEEEIEKAVRRGAGWLKKQRRFNSPLDLKDEYSTIGILALLHAGEFERDPALAERCVDYLLRRPLHSDHGTYATAITAMALGDWDRQAYSQRVLECAQWLVENQGWNEINKVWEYGVQVPGIGAERKVASIGKTGAALEVVRRGLIVNPNDRWDNSCSQFAVLGLHAAAQAGIKLPRESWERVEKHFRETQVVPDGWGYNTRGVTGSMTCSGLASSLIARHYLGRDKSQPDLPVLQGLEWLAEHFTVAKNPNQQSQHYYYLYGLERVGVLAGTEFLGDHEWYPEGARFLLAQQNGDGSWNAKDDSDYLNTCYAILFLRRATLSFTPRPLPPQPKVVERRAPPTLAVRYRVQDPKYPVLTPLLAPAVELMLDASGSMKDNVDGEPKYLIARRVLNQFLDDIPDHVQVGFRVFGHMGFWGNKKGLPEYEDPGYYTDSELMISIGPLKEGKRRQLIKDWVDYIKPAGATPLVYSLLQARADFPRAWKGPKMVLLVSDGEENCGGKMEDVAKAYQGTGIDVIIHIVGFGVPPKEEKQLKEIARLSGGQYFNTTNAKELSAALRLALRSTRFFVVPQGGKLTFGLLNGPPLALKAGIYHVGIPQTGVRPIEIRLEDGQAVEVSLDEAGRLVAAATALLPKTKTSAK